MPLLGILLILAGILAAASLIVQKQPNAGEMIKKLVPFQGIIGIILLLWGIYALLFLILPYIGLIMQFFPIRGLAAIAASLVAIGLGIILGYGLISQYALSKNADAARSGEAVRAKLTGIQVPLGIAGIVLGLWVLISFLGSGV
ncbi:MAG: hypothetical protein QOJ64_2995 [Acidobacteriota bacterium]|jgi:hypothetical protein|nr:hypothetical protein [Acidobacteriota bacterium]